MAIHRLLCALVALSLAVPAMAAERTVGVGSFSRVRIEGAFDVVVRSGSPAVKISGERREIEALDVHTDGETLVVRRSASGGRADRSMPASPVAVSLATPMLAAAIVTGDARVAIARMAGRQVSLSIAGAGGVTVAAVAADRVDALVIGAGSLTIAGKTATARLTTNGLGTIDAAKLDAGDLVVRLDGLGTTRAAARYTATVTNAGLGTVAIAGGAKCTVTSSAGGPVTCGPPR